MSNSGDAYAQAMSAYDDHIKESVAAANKEINNAMKALDSLQADFAELQNLVRPSEPAPTKLSEALSSKENLDEFLMNENPQDHFLPRVRQTPSTVVSFLAAVTAELIHSPDPAFLRWVSEALLNVDTAHRDLAEATLQVLTRIQSLLPALRRAMPEEARVTNEIGYILQSLLLGLKEK